VFGKVLIISIAALVVWGVVVRASSGAGPEHVYVVHPRDTLWTIAAKTYGGDPRAGIWKIQKANHLAGATIVPGQRLHIPG
jgi:nucleoid-associated protein YgaU